MTRQGVAIEIARALRDAGRREVYVMAALHLIGLDRALAKSAVFHAFHVDTQEG